VSGQGVAGGSGSSSSLPKPPKETATAKKQLGAGHKKGGPASSVAASSDLAREASSEDPKKQAEKSAPGGRPLIPPSPMSGVGGVGGVGVGRRGKTKATWSWVQCERCDKWRKLPPHVSVDKLPEKWFCHMNQWDPNRASCSAEQELDDKEKALANQAFGEPSLPGLWTAQKRSATRSCYRDLIFNNKGDFLSIYLYPIILLQ
jgi:hypothetical protein